MFSFPPLLPQPEMSRHTCPRSAPSLQNRIRPNNSPTTAPCRVESGPTPRAINVKLLNEPRKILKTKQSDFRRTNFRKKAPQFWGSPPPLRTFPVILSSARTSPKPRPARDLFFCETNLVPFPDTSPPPQIRSEIHPPAPRPATMESPLP